MLQLSDKPFTRERLLSVASTAACTEDIERQSFGVDSNSVTGGSGKGGGLDSGSGGEGSTASTSGSSSSSEAPAAALEFRIRYERNVRRAAHAFWLRLFGILAEAIVFAAVVHALGRSSSYIAYMLLFAIFAPAGYLFNHLVQQLKDLDRDFCCVNMTLCQNSRRDRHLMEALLWQLSKTEGLANRAEAFIERQDNPSGGATYEVELRPMQSAVTLYLERGARSQRVAIWLDGREDGGVPGKAYITIRTSKVLDFMFTIWRRSSATAVIAEAQDNTREFLHRWLQHIHADYMRTSKGIIEVYELTKNHADEPPVWTRVRQERGVTSCGEGMWHYAAGEWANQLKNRAEYAIRHRGKTRVTLFLSGSKGSGKTLFVEWLAGELGLPLYNIDLGSPHVTNEVLREVVTPNRLVHNLPVIFHFDEFQTMIEEWSANQALPAEGPPHPAQPRSLVTIQGLQCMLEGTSTPNNAIFVFTSSKPLPTMAEISAAGGEGHEWRGLLRRIPVQVQIPPMGSTDRLEFCRQFLAAYLPRPWDPSAPRETARWVAFEEAWSKSEMGVPFDMLAKYAQERTHEAYICGMMTSLPEGCKVQEECRERYLDAFFNVAQVQKWMCDYAGNISGCHTGEGVGAK